ncbi:MAG: hypothetical protein LBK25_07120 [Treponema sp.]|jgi:hypothetical protein|nr:hypothetical protein [Treponema sp.]
MDVLRHDDPPPPHYPRLNSYTVNSNNHYTSGISGKTVLSAFFLPFLSLLKTPLSAEVSFPIYKKQTKIALNPHRTATIPSKTSSIADSSANNSKSEVFGLRKSGIYHSALFVFHVQGVATLPFQIWN